MYCLTCICWEGDREGTQKMIDKHGDVVMDWEKGFPLDGDCACRTEWATIEVHGDATASFEVPANFGCIFHKPVTTDKE